LGSVLLVDDDKLFTYKSKKILENIGYEVDIVYTGYDALTKLESHLPDLIFLDYTLPGINGIETLQEIRKFNKLSAIIIASNSSSQELIISALRNQADDFIQKPINFYDIGPLITNHIKKRKELFNETISRKLKYKSNEIFENLLILKESIPIFSIGKLDLIEKISSNIDLKSDSGDEVLVSSFLSAIENYSNSIFKKNLNYFKVLDYIVIFNEYNNMLGCIILKLKVYNNISNKNLVYLLDNCLETIIDKIDPKNSYSYGLPEKIKNDINEEILNRMKILSTLI
jgi:CheY-like chemotaxis protein